MKLTNAQIKILHHYQEYHGKQWRARLRWGWEHGRYTLGDAECQQLRNELGDVWLKAYHPGDVQVGWLARVHYEIPYASSYHWVHGYCITHKDGKDMIQPYCRTKTEVRQLARDLKITLIE